MARSKQVFNSEQPIKDIKWSFSGKNLTSGENVAVKTEGVASGSEIKVDFPQNKIKNSSIQVTFPVNPENAIFELKATAEIVDVFGNQGQFRKTISSHALTGENPETLVENIIPAIANIAAVPPEKDLLNASKIAGLPEDDRLIKDPYHRCARMLRLFALHSSEDKMIDMGEFKRLNKTAELCKTK